MKSFRPSDLFNIKSGLTASPEDQMRHKYAWRTSLIFGLAALGVFIFGLIDAIPIPNWMSGVTLATNLILALAGLASAGANRKQYNPRAVLGMLAVLWCGGLLIVLMTSGLGLILTVAVFTLSTSIAIQALPIKLVNRAILVSLLFASALYLAEIFIGYERDVASPEIINVLPWAVAGVALVFGVFLFQRFEQFPLLTKIVVPFVAILLAAIGILAYFNYVTVSQALSDAANEKLRSAALQTASQVDAYFDLILSGLEVEASLPDFVNYFALSSANREGSEEGGEALSQLYSLQARGGSLSYSILDISGKVLLTTLPDHPTELSLAPADGNDEKTALQMAVSANGSYISPVFYDRQTNQPSIYFARAITGEDGAAGVLVAHYNLRRLQTEIFEPNAGMAGIGSFPVLFNEKGVRLASGLGAANLDKLAAPLSAAEMQVMVDEGSLPDLALEELATANSALAESLLRFQLQLAVKPANPAAINHAQQSASFETEEAGFIGLLNAVVVPVPAKEGWKVVFMQDQSVVLAPVEANQHSTSLMLFVIFGISIGLSSLIAQAINRPVLRLTESAQRVQQGDFSVQVSVKSEDEIGLLSNVFNSMTAQLSQMLTGLEKRVEERTQQLALASRQTEERAEQLETIAEIARAVATERDLDKLLPLITRSISERFGFYHVGIFLLDARNEYAVLRAANSEGGQRMLARGHRLAVGQQGIVGFVTSRGTPRVALDVGKDATYFNNPDLPQTRSEIALPLKSGDLTIGALDVQSTEASAFDKEDEALLTTLADQVAIAIENARLFRSTNQALDELRAVQRQYLREKWIGRKEARANSGYEYDQGQVRPLGAGSQNSEGGQSLLSVPIHLRGEVIGSIDLDKLTGGEQANRKWTEEETRLAQAVAEQVGLALENARLLEETQQRAEREALVAQITNRLRASNDPQVILQTAVVELKRALKAHTTNVVIPNNPKPETTLPAGQGGTQQVKPQADPKQPGEETNL